MEEATAAATTTTTTYTDVITKFKDLKRKYYTDRGCMISTVDDDFAKEFLGKHPNLLWEEKYNAYAEAYVLMAKINVIIFEQPFAVYLYRPIKEIHRFEYEDFFGFGGHCEGFSFDRIIATYAERFDDNIDVVARGVAVAARNETGFRCGNMRVGLNREHEALILARK